MDLAKILSYLIRNFIVEEKIVLKNQSAENTSHLYF